MCGGCGTGSFDELGSVVAGPRRRAAVAAAATTLVRGLRVRVADRAWTVSERTGKVTVCRTVEDLVDVIERHGVERSGARTALVHAAELAPAPS
jgi:hypothetical protein